MAQATKTYRAYKVVLKAPKKPKQYLQATAKFGLDAKKAEGFDKDTADKLATRFRDAAAKIDGILEVEPVKPQPSYRAAIAWIAEMDEGASMDPDTMSGVPSVLLTAVMFGMTDMQVAEDVVARRRKRQG